MSEHLHIPAYRHKADSTVSYGNPAYWRNPEQWERVHVLTDDELADLLLTDPAIEAAAQALHGSDDWDNEYEETREQYRQDAHDAIQAAIGAVNGE